jgi:ATP-dependent RNA helicase DeaD
MSTGFDTLQLAKPLLKALDDVGYETPSPIQSAMIPHMLAGRDVVGQAQTGTGKTAAFALPLLSRLDLKKLVPQVLVLTPTRELAIQVAEAFQRYAAHMRSFHVMPVYGGQPYGVQLHQLKRGVHVVVGTPGRLMDHIGRGTLNLDALLCLVLDEGDEMLRMGFIDDVEWILARTPPGRQIALFSATMPTPIRRIAQQYLKDPEEITIKVRTMTADTINQRFWMVDGRHKLDALTRILEGEPFDGMLVFVRTRTATVELADKLAARGYASAALNGDIPQAQRERTVERFKSGKLDILVATDVAARGLDMDRISHVINYDIPYDTEAYIHRVGRTGRAGRTGEAILFVAPRERRLLAAIERATKQKIAMMDLPSTEAINDKRIATFKQRITDTLATEELGFFYQMLEQYRQDHNVPALNIASALAKLLQGDEPLLLTHKSVRARPDNLMDRESRSTNRGRMATQPEAGMERFRIEVGHNDGVKPGNIVGAIANEAGLDSQYIGRIDIFDDFSILDLPEGMPRTVVRALRKVWVMGKQLQISRLQEPQSSLRTQKLRTGKSKARTTASRKTRPGKSKKFQHSKSRSGSKK